MVSLTAKPPFRITCYDKAYSQMFVLGDPKSISCTPRHLALPTGSLTLPLGHPRVPALMAEGTRVNIEYLTGPDRTDPASWLQLMSGPLWTRNGQSATSTPPGPALVTFGIEDDYRVLAELLAWQNPGAAIGSQTAAAYDVQSSDAETVIKHYVSANATRLSIPLTVATNGHRGSTVKANLRMANLNDSLPPLAQLGGIGITVRQVGTGMVLDVYVPTDRTANVLTEASGAVLQWAFTQGGPSATRAIMGAQGAGTARNFSEVIDATGLEALWGRKSEVFVDASDTSDAPTIAQRGAAALAAGQPVAGFSLSVAETDVVKYGKNLFVGDLVAVQITPELVVEDVLSECTLTWSTDKGLAITPQVGSATSASSPAAKLNHAISQLRAQVRQIVRNT